MPSSLTLTVTVVPDSGSAPLAVVLTAYVQGGAPPYSYAWDPGDGTTSNLSGLVHTYEMAGDYSVSVRVTDSVGDETSVGPLPVTVSQAIPNATFSPLNGQICAVGVPGPISQIPAPPDLESLPSGPYEEVPGSYYDNCLGEEVAVSGVDITLTLVLGP